MSDVPLAITKAVDDAKKNLFTVPKHGTTITHEILGRSDAARVLLRLALVSALAVVAAGCGSGGDDGAKQWAYKGKPLYGWVKDTKPGDKIGDGFLNGAWHVAK